MKIYKLLLVAALAATFSAAAFADTLPPDPKITIVKGGGSPTTTLGFDQADPIIVANGSGVTDFLYEGPVVSILFIEVIPAATDIGGTIFKGDFFTCDPGIATACFAVSPTVLPAVEFAFAGPQGLFAPGLDLQVSVPEPGIILLLIAGLAALVFAGRKRMQAVQA